MSSPQPDPVADIARRLRLTEPDEEMLDAIADALADAESDVHGYLGRPIRPVTRTAGGCWPVPGGWDIPTEHGRIRRIVSTTPETFPDSTETGTFAVTYEVGIDYLADPDTGPIRRYVRAAAMNNPELLQRLASAGARGPVTNVSVSTEGQSKSVTYGSLAYGGGGQAGTDSPGALPSITLLDKWRIRGRRVVQAPDPGYDARLHTGSGAAGPAWRDRDGFWNAP